MNSLIPAQNGLQQDGLPQALKVTSLLYLQEALNKEAYEQCAQILQAAQEIGVDTREISRVIGQHLVNLKQRDRAVVRRR